MNARSVYRKLMRNRHDVLWGARAFVSVAIPIEALPEPFPAFAPPNTVELYSGAWLEETPDGCRLWSVDSLIGSVEDVPADAAWARRSGSGSAEWVQGTVIRYSTPQPERDAILGEEPMPTDMVMAHLACEDWIDRWVHGRGNEVRWLDDPAFDPLDPPSIYFDHAGAPWGREDPPGWFCHLWRAANASRTVYHSFGEGFLTLTFSVKWKTHPSGRRAVAREIAAACEHAQAVGLRLRVRSPRRR